MPSRFYIIPGLFPFPLEPGSRLGAYEIHPLLGSGGMGEVYRCRDTTLEREVAIFSRLIADQASQTS